MNKRRTYLFPATRYGLGLACILTGLGMAWGQAPAEDCKDGAECANERGTQLQTLVVEADRPADIGRTRYTADDIAEMPTGDGHLSDLLRLNTAVDFSRDANQSANSATLKPGEISIHGQPFYQNLFTIDGLDMSSDLDPANNQDVWSSPSLVGPTGGSSPQGYFLDVDLLESIEVFDSNVPATFGGFTGGVVSTRLKRYAGENSVALRYGISRDEWERFHVDSKTRDSIDSNYRGNYTPDYLRQNYGLSLQQGLTDDTGLTMNVSRRASRFAQTYRDSADALRKIDFNDRIDNVLGRIDTRLGSDMLGLSFRYTDRRHDGITSRTYDSPLTQSHESYGATFQWERRLDIGDFSLDLGLDRLSDHLDSEESRFTQAAYLEGSGRPVQSGGYGDTKQSQTRTVLAPEWQFNALAFGQSRHHLTTGGRLRNTQSRYERLTDVRYEKYDCLRRAKIGCVDQNGDGKSGPEDAYLSRAFDYYAGEVTLNYNDLAWYLQDRIELGDWTFTPGLRADWESYLKNTDIAPRFKVEWDTFGDDSTRLVAGANRYYGRSFLRYQLNDAISSWRQLRFFDKNGNETVTRRYEDNSGTLNLKTPYADEWMVGWQQRLGPLDARLQFVNRESRDGVLREETEEGETIYNNEGRSSTDSLTLDLALATPWKIGATRNRASLGISYRDTKRSSYQGGEGYNTEPGQELIYYDGRLITEDELPAWDFNIPLDIRLQTVTQVPKWYLTWSNFINLRQGGTVTRDSRENYQDPTTGLAYDIYEDVDFKDLITVDTRIRWEPPLLSKARGYVQLEVQNLFDETVDYSTSDYSRQYTAGRSGNLEFGVRF